MAFCRCCSMRQRSEVLMNKVLLVVLFLFSVSFAAEWTEDVFAAFESYFDDGLYYYDNYVYFDDNGFSKSEPVDYDNRRGFKFVAYSGACICSLQKNAVEVNINGGCYNALELWEYGNDKERMDSLWFSSWVTTWGYDNAFYYEHTAEKIQELLLKDNWTANDSTTYDSLQREVSQKWLPNYQEKLDDFIEYGSVSQPNIEEWMNNCGFYDLREMEYISPLDSIAFLYKRQNAYYAVCKIYSYCSKWLFRCLFNDEKWPSRENFPKDLPQLKVNYTSNISQKKVPALKTNSDDTFQFKANGCWTASGNASGVYLGKSGGKVQLKK